MCAFVIVHKDTAEKRGDGQQCREQGEAREMSWRDRKNICER